MVWRRKIGIFPWHPNSFLKLLKSGEPFFGELLTRIESAQNNIHIQVYIFEPDTTGKLVYAALLKAAARGVKIILWLDAYGSKNFPEIWEKEMEEQGIEVNYFSRFKFAFKYSVGMRLHHKIFIFDNQIALLGGINISDHYSHFGNEKTWLDYGVRVEGNVVIDLLQICQQIEKGPLNIFPGDKQTPVYSPKAGLFKARVLQNHWSKAKFGISRQYRQAIRKSQKEIILLSSYFLPSPALKRLLKKAAQRGVRVQLVLGSLSDVGVMRHASHYFYSDLLKAGVEIWEWQPSVLHAKLAFVDQNWVCIGSYNLNHLSDFGSVECNLEIRDFDFHDACIKEIMPLLEKDALPIHGKEYLQKISWLHFVRNWCSYRIISLSLKLLFLLQKKER